MPKHHPLLRLAVSSMALTSSSGRSTCVSAAIIDPVPSPPAPAFCSSTTQHQHICFSWKRRFSCSKTLNMASSAILESPSAERNKGPIYDKVLAPIVYPQLIKNVVKDKRNKVYVLELAAGCGVHSTHFASSFLAANEGIGLEWHPSDPDAEGRLSIDARVQEAKLGESFIPANSWILGKSGGTSCNDPNRDRGDSGLSQSGIDGDTSAYSKYHSYFDYVMCINMIHISPWSATVGLMECAGKVLRKGGILMCYGPYKVGGTAVESNLRFDASLQSRNPDWGVRNLEDVVQVAKSEGELEFVQSIEMPANNQCVLFRKA